MTIGINQFSWPTSMDVKDSIKKSAELGYKNFEACFTLSKENIRTTSGVTDTLGIDSYYNRLLNEDSSQKDILELGKIAKSSGIDITSVGGVMTFSIFSLMSDNPKVAEKSMNAVKKMIDAAQILEAKKILVIPGVLEQGMEYKSAYLRVQERISRLADYAGDTIIAVENVWNNFLYSPLEICNFVDDINKKNVGVYFDIGNAKRFGYPEDWIETLGHRIKGLHVKDYRVANDNINSFTNLLDGDINWSGVIKSLREIKYNDDLIVEIIPPAKFLVDKTLLHSLEVLEILLEEEQI